MKLIVESGATKSEWLVVGGDGKEKCRFAMPGMNVSTMSLEDIRAIVCESALKIDAGDISALHFYTAGVIDQRLQGPLEDIFRGVFANLSFVEMQSDLLAAARAVCGRGAGIAAILGTGSNSCEYDGERITAHVNSGGFILGDEGSAARLGLIFLQDLIKGLVPEPIAAEFSSRYDGSYAGIVANVYSKSQSPSGYLGSFAPFILEHYDNPYIKEIVDGNFRAFFERCIKLYRPLPVGIVGGFGCACKDIILGIAAEYGVEISTFVHSPIDYLVSYHK